MNETMEMIEMKEFKYIEEGLIENPHYESHKRGRNWASKITGKNSVEFQRENLRQIQNKISISNIQVGDAIELGGDYISSGGNRRPDRGYYLILEINSDSIIAKPFPSIATLLKEKNKSFAKAKV